MFPTVYLLIKIKVLSRNLTIWAIEVKSGRKKSSKGLEAFQKKYPGSRLAIITPEEYKKFEKDPIAYLEKVS